MKRAVKAKSRTKETSGAVFWNTGVDSSDADALQRDIGETKGVLVHVPLRKWRALKYLGVDQGKTLQVLMMEAITLLLDENSLPGSKDEQ
jgi:hypothetical protein